jgi:hypothetical protein
MAMYRDPQAAMSVLMGGPPTPEEQEIANRIMTQGLPQALGNLPPPPAPMNAPMAPMGPPAGQQMAQAPDSNMQRAPFLDPGAMDKEQARSNWMMQNESTPVPWDPNITWGQYIAEIWKKGGDKARDAIINEQLENQEQKAPPTKMPVIPSVPMPGVPGGPPLEREAIVPVDQQGIMRAANGGLSNTGIFPFYGDFTPGQQVNLREQLANIPGYEQFVSTAPVSLASLPAPSSPTLNLTPNSVEAVTEPSNSQVNMVKAAPSVQSEPISGEISTVSPSSSVSRTGRVSAPKFLDVFSEGLIDTDKFNWSDLLGSGLNAALNPSLPTGARIGGGIMSALSLPIPGALPFSILGGLTNLLSGPKSDNPAELGFGPNDRVVDLGQGMFQIFNSNQPGASTITSNPGGAVVDAIEAGNFTAFTGDPDPSELAELGEGPDDGGGGSDVGESGEDLSGWGGTGVGAWFAKGGLVRFAEGGINEIPAAASVDEGEFMGILSQLSNEADIPAEQVDLVAKMATQTTGEAPPVANDNTMDSGIMQNVEAVETTENEMAGIGSLTELSDRLAAAGQEPLVHASPGEIVFNPDILPENQRDMLYAALQAEGIDPAELTIGNPENVINKMTGLPAFFTGFFKKIFKGIGKGVKKVGKFIKKNAGTILGVAGALTGNPWMAALGTGIGSLIEGKPLQSALLGAGLSYAGAKWVAPWVGKQLTSLAPSLATPLGEAIPYTAPGGFIQEATKQGLTRAAAEKTAAEAATKAALDLGTNVPREALQKAAIEAANLNLQAAATAGLTPTAITEGAREIGTQAARNVLGGTVKSLAQTALPQRVLTTAVGRTLAQPTGAALGQAITGGLQMAAQPLLEGAILGIPGPDQQAALDAFNARYNYTPSAGELYQFYTNEYVPNQQVNTQQTIGTLPGYGIMGAAGGGYLNGVGGPKSDSNLARLSDGEFVMTEAAVRGAGNGDRMEGARKMYDMMHSLERRVA